MDQIEAFASIAIATCASDGELDPLKEAESLKHYLDFQAPFRNIDKANLIEKIISNIKENGIKQVVTESCLILNQNQKESVLALSVHLSHSDGKFCEYEKEFISFLIEKLDMNLEKSHQIVESINILNRDSFSY
mgnify:CR=1 FL=1